MTPRHGTENSTTSSPWVAVCRTADVPENAGACALVDGVQIAIFRIPARNAYYAVQNRCPHWNEMVLWRGMTGEQDGEPKVACPMHKRSFSLESGACLTDATEALATFALRIVGDVIEIARPSTAIDTANRG